MTTEKQKKDTLRKQAKEIRDKLNLDLLSEELCTTLKCSQIYKRAKHILSYLAFGSEIDLSSLHSDKGKTFYTTRTHFKPQPHLTVHNLKSKLEQHKYGYWQPIKNSLIVDPTKVDLVFVPGLAFDKKGGRLGYGMGFYDRLLEKVTPGVPLVAITSEELLFDQLPQEPWDKHMTYIATQTGIHTINT